MQTRDLPVDLVVPPKRLVHLLSGVRLERGFTLEEAAKALGGHWNALYLLEAETGQRPLMDPEIHDLANLYDIDVSNLIPSRSHLIVDLDDGFMSIDGQLSRFESTQVERQEVLKRYLALVYVMRQREPGSAIPLRLTDLEILSGVLSVDKRTVEDQLRIMMVKADRGLTSRISRLKGRLFVPAAGVLVASTTMGALILASGPVGADESPVTPQGDAVSETSDDELTSSPEAFTNEPIVEFVPVEIGDAIQQERNEDGTPGPVTIRE